MTFREMLIEIAKTSNCKPHQRKNCEECVEDWVELYGSDVMNLDENDPRVTMRISEIEEGYAS